MDPQGSADLARYRCLICHYIYNEKVEGVFFDDLPPDWICPVCGAPQSEFERLEDEPAPPPPRPAADWPAGPAPDRRSLEGLRRAADDLETHMTEIHRLAQTGESIIEPMRSARPVVSWDDILILGAQLARLPLERDATVDTTTVIGPKARRPLVLGTPIIVSHMSFGAVSKEAQQALAKGSAAAGTAMSSGEGGVLPDVLALAH